MTRVRLRLTERTLLVPCSYREPSAPADPPVSLPLLRLTAEAVVQPAPGARGVGRALTALVDTGSWLSVLELTVWSELDALGLVEHLPFADAAPQLTSVAGHTLPFRLGRVWVALIDPTPNRIVSLPAVPVIAQLLENPTPALAAYPLILSLHRGVLDGRKLTREVVSPQPAARATDRGPQFAQEWFLETP